MADLGDDAGQNFTDASKKGLKMAGQMISEKLEPLESRAEKARAVSKAMAEEHGVQSLEREIPHAPMSR